MSVASISAIPSSQSAVYVVDSSLEDLASLLAGLPAGAELVLLDPNQDGLTQILNALDGHSGVDALHILTHGSAGNINLGNTSLNSGTLPSASASLEALAQHLSADADILFYGCDVAANDEGKALVSLIADLTGADVAASTDLTGASSLGGDWQFEFAVGNVQALPVEILNFDSTLGSDSSIPSGLVSGPPYSWGGNTFQTRINAELTSSDPVNSLRSGCYWDRYTLSDIPNGATVKVYMGNSSTVDDYIQIERNGTVITQNDDGGDGERSYDAYVSWTYQTGDIIRATTYSAGNTGTYSLWIGTSATISGGNPPPPTDIGSSTPPPATAPAFTDSNSNLGTVADTPANDTALANITGTLTASDTTPTGTLSYSGGGTQTYGTLSVSSNGAFTFNPNEAAINGLAAGASASHTFTVTVSDGALSSSKNLTVSFTGSNDLPTVAGNATMPGILEDAGNTSATNAGTTVANLFGSRFADLDNGASFKGIYIASIGDTTGQGTWRYSTDDGASWNDLSATTTLLASHKLQFVPAADWSGTPGALTVKVIDNNDGQSLATATVSIAVAAVNDAPTFTDATTITGTVTDSALYDTNWSGSTTTGTLAATDIENDATSFSIRGGTLSTGVWTAHGVYGTLTVDAATGAYTYTPTNTAGINALPAGKTVHDSFEFKVSDTAGAYSSRSLDISISGTNDTPELKAGVNPVPDQSFSGAGAWQFQIPADSFTDAEGAGLTYTVQVVDGSGNALDVGAGTGNLPTWLTFSESTRSFSGDPPASWNNASLNLKVTATDPTGASVNDTFSLALSNTGNQPPVVASPIGRHVASPAAETTEITFTEALGGQTLTFNNLTGGTPGDDTSVTFGSTVTAAQVAAAVVAAGATGNYTVALKAPGSDTVVFKAKTVGDVTDADYANVINGGTFNGSAAVTKIADGANPGTPESFTIEFGAYAGNPDATLRFDGANIVVDGRDTNGIGSTGPDVANYVASVTYTNWTAAQVGTTNAVIFTQTSVGNISDVTTAAFTGTYDGAKTITAKTDGTGYETFEVQYSGGLGGSTLIFDGVTTTAGSGVTAANAAAAFLAALNSNGAYTGALKNGDNTTVILTNKTGGNATDIQLSDFSGTYTGVTAGTPTDGGAWTYTFPAGTFSDPDSDALTYTAWTVDTNGIATQITTTAGSHPINFDAASRTFTGDGTGGPYLIELRATDASGSNTEVSTRFQLYLDDGVDSDVTVGATILTQTWTGAGLKSFQIPADAFNFNDGAPDTLEYSAKLSDNNNLPNWLSLDTTTGLLSGNPPADAPASLNIVVTATEKQGGTTTASSNSQPFTLNIATPNDAPTVINPLADQLVAEGAAVAISTGAVFADADGSAITYTVTQADGSALPTWLSWNWNGSNLNFNGNPPGNLPYLNLKVTGTDTGGASTNSTFTLYLQDPGATGSTGALTANNPGAVGIVGNPASINEGDTLTASTPTDTDGSPLPGNVTYQWQVQISGTWTDIAGARGQGNSLTLTNDEAGKSVRVQAFYTDGGGVAEAPVSGAVSVINVETPGVATISGNTAIGEVQTVTLTDGDGLINVTPTYQWYRSAENSDSGYTAISGATNSSYVTTSADGDRYLKAVVGYTDNQGTTYTIASGTVADRTNAVIQRGQVAPVAHDDTGSVTEASGVNNGTPGTNIVIGNNASLFSNDTDANAGDTKTVTEVRLGSDLGSGVLATEAGNTFTLSGNFGTLTVDKSTGVYTYAVNQANSQVQGLAPGGTLSDVFNYTIEDSTSLSASAKLTITINGANDAPTADAIPESSTVVEDLAGFISTGLLLNDPDLGAGTSFALKLAVSSGRLLVVDPTAAASAGVTIKGSDTGTLTLTGSMSDITNWLQGDVIKYAATPNALGTNVATLTLSANDGSGFVSLGTQTLDVTASNDAPILDLDANNSSGKDGNNFITTFRPRGEAVAIVDGDISITDVDSGDTLVSGTVSIATGALDNEFGTTWETLSSSAGSSYTGSLGVITISGNGTPSITLSGAGSHADYEAVLKTITYTNANPNAYSGDRTISISVTDAAGVNASASNLASFTTSVANTGIAVGQKIYLGGVDTGQTVAAVLDSQHFVASGPLTGLTPTASLSFATTAAVGSPVTNTTSFAVETASAAIKAGLTIYKNGVNTGLTVVSASGTSITASGNITLAVTDVLSFQTTATNNTPVPATTTVRVPWTSVVDMDGTASSSRDYTTSYTEDAQPVSIATSTASIDNQAINIKTFTVTLTNPLDGTNGNSEELSISASMIQTLAAKGITATVAGNKHSITFSTGGSGATATDMQLGLRAVKYVNNDQNPSITPRTISTHVVDVANETGVAATTTINVIPVNDAPVKGGDFAGTLNEAAVYVFTAADLNSTDVDNAAGTLKYVLTAAPIQGTLFRDTNSNGIVDTGEAIATVGNSTSVASINAIGTAGYFTQAEVNAGQIKYAHNGQNPNATNPTGTDTFGFKVVDGMEDYAFANIATNQAGTVTLTITEVNDAATGTPVVSGTLQPGQVLSADVSSIADPDGPVSPTFNYQWKVSSDGTNWTNASGAGSTTVNYTLAAADQGKQVRVEVSFNDAFGRPNTLTGNASGTVAFTNTQGAGGVTITSDGTPQAGETLTVNTSALTDADGLGPFNYQWQISTDGGNTWGPIGGATATTYTLPGNAGTGAQYKAVVTYTDGRGNSEHIDSSTVTVVAPASDINDAPSLTGSGAFPANTALFSDVTVTTVESGQTIQTLTLTVSGLQDGGAEKLSIDGIEIDLVTTGATALVYPTPAPAGSVGGIGYAVTTASGTATVTITHAGLSAAQTKTLTEGLAYANTAATPTAGLRVVTLTSLQDSGGTASGGLDTGAIGLSATVDVGSSLPASNTPPTPGGDGAATVAEGAVVTLTTADLSATDAEQTGLKLVLASAPANGTLFRDTNNDGVVNVGEALGANSQFALADIAAGRIKYAHDGGETTADSFSFNVSDGLALSDSNTGNGTANEPTIFTITVTPQDDAPTLTATALGSSGIPVAYAEGAAAQAIFTGTAASPVEAGENITGITVMISGLRDGAAEKLVIDGTAVALTNGTAGSSTGGHAVAYSVSVTGGTAIVTLTLDASAATWNALVDGLKYDNTSNDPAAGHRTVTLTSVTETGNTSTALALTSHVAVVTVNNAPTLTLSPITVTEGGSKTLTTTDIAAADLDTPLGNLTYTLSTAPAHGAVYIDADGDGVQDNGEALSTGGTFTHAQLSSGVVRYQHDDGENSDSFAVTVSDGQGGISTPVTMTVNRIAVNDAPGITGLGSDVLNYNANSGARLLEQGGNVVVSDPDSANFNGGNLRVSITFNRDPAHDALSIASAGTGAGQVSLDGSNVKYEGTTIGTVTGGTGTNDLVVSFNTSATPVAVSALIKAVQFANDQAAPAHTTRTVSFALNDGQAGGQAAPVAVNVNIATGVTPSISIANGFFIVENTQLITALSATDPNARPITFSISGTVDPTNNPDNGKFEIVSGNLLRFKAAPDYETPADSGANNVYNVIVRATNDLGSYAEQTLSVTVLDQNPENAAVGDTDGPTFGYATVSGSSLVLTYTDASPLSTSNLPATSAFAVKVGGTPVVVNTVTVNASAKTITLTLATAVTAGQNVTVAYTDPTAGNDIAALQDTAGNDAATLPETSVTNVTPSSGGNGSGGSSGGSSGGGGSTGGTGGGTTTVTNEGIPVTTVTQPGVNGTSSTTQSVDPIIPPNAGGGSGGNTPTQYTVPLAVDHTGNTVIQVGLPAGVGIQSIATEGENLTLRQRLVGASNPLVSNDSEFTQIVQNGIDQYVPTVLNPTTVTVRALTLTVPSGSTGAPLAPVLITGNTSDPSALVIDARQLPSGTVLQVNNVTFAVVIGAAHLTGGAGQNFVVGDDNAQYIVLGADDDTLHGGGGNDTVGSLGGNDTTFGDNGNDIVFGGTGNDKLSGGAGNDQLNGGLGYDVATQSGILADYKISVDGNAVVLTNLATGEQDRLLDVERVDFVSGPSLTIAYSEADAAAQHLVTTWLGRNLTADEGAVVRGWVGATAEQVAALFRTLAIAESVRDKSIAELLAGLDTNPNILRLNVADHYFGSAQDEQGYLPIGLGVVIDAGGGHDILQLAGQRSDFHLEGVSGGVELTRLSDGAMYSLKNAEMIAFDSGERVVLAETQEDAMLARLFQTLLDRDATTDEWKLGPKALDEYHAGHLSMDNIFSWFYAQTDIDTLNNSSYVQRLYTNTYGRSASDTELSNQLHRLSSGEVSRDGLAIEIASSAEAVQVVGSVIAITEV
ncbi:DUF4347 domain-containing protein [Zoogloea sp. LCSB751]|uniref:DUF4347 domain-containing protein n=1 Tax=Zoogloea sp. LCSB751 TaxID=1965277 RepID=UPI0009A54DF7|nr:DUF4347 domain-containing protein [Zoogloea sp. LCSB751]